MFIISFYIKEGFYMRISKIRQKLKNRGVAMVEYAILLAFVTAGSGLFASDSLGNSITGVMDRVVAYISTGESGSSKGSFEKLYNELTTNKALIKKMYAAANFNSAEDFEYRKQNEKNNQAIDGEETINTIATLLGDDNFSVQLMSSIVPGNPNIKFLVITTDGRYRVSPDGNENTTVLAKNESSPLVNTTIFVYKNKEFVACETRENSLEWANNYIHKGLNFKDRSFKKYYEDLIMNN